MKVARILALLASILLASVLHAHHACHECTAHGHVDHDEGHGEDFCICDLEDADIQLQRNAEPRVPSLFGAVVGQWSVDADADGACRRTTRTIRPPPRPIRLLTRYLGEARGTVLLQ